MQKTNALITRFYANSPDTDIFYECSQIFFDAFKTVDGFKIVTELNDQRAVKNQNLNTCLSSQAVEDTNQIKI